MKHNSIKRCAATQISAFWFGSEWCWFQPLSFLESFHRTSMLSEGFFGMQVKKKSSKCSSKAANDKGANTRLWWRRRNTETFQKAKSAAAERRSLAHFFKFLFIRLDSDGWLSVMMTRCGNRRSTIPLSEKQPKGILFLFEALHTEATCCGSKSSSETDIGFLTANVWKEKDTNEYHLSSSFPPGYGRSYCGSNRSDGEPNGEPVSDTHFSVVTDNRGTSRTSWLKTSQHVWQT